MPPPESRRVPAYSSAALSAINASSMIAMTARAVAGNRHRSLTDWAPPPGQRIRSPRWQPEQEKAPDRVPLTHRLPATRVVSRARNDHVLPEIAGATSGLYELAGQPPNGEASRAAALHGSVDGKLALAVVWSRKFRTHDLIEVTEPGDKYTDKYTETYGTLEWRNDSHIASVMTSPLRKRPPRAADHTKLGYYAAHLAGRTVLDTFQRGLGALLAII